jgi:signal transduction histidine kinase
MENVVHGLNGTATDGGAPVAMLNRLRLFEKTLAPLVLTATLLAITIGMGVTVLHRTVASYREILSRNAPAVLRIERLNALTDVIGYSIARNLTYRCLGQDAAGCARAQSALNAAAAEGEQRLDEAVRFDPAHRADYDHFRQAFRAVVEPARAAMALGLKDDKAAAQAMGTPVHARVLALSEELARYSNQRTTDNRTEGLALAARASDAERGMILVGALATVLGLGIAAWIGFVELTMPISRLRGRMAQLAGGELDIPVEGQDRLDEIGQMARAVQVFKENAHARLLAEAEAEQARGAARDAQAEIARVARMLSVGELASSIAHEISQPIGAIAANGQAGLRWLEHAPPDVDHARTALERTVRDAQRASAIISRVRGMLAKTNPEFVAVDVNAVIQDVLGFIEDERRRAEVAIRIRLASRLPPVLGDPIQLQQVMLNLVMNGMDAMRANPANARALSLGSSVQAPGAIEVTVDDRGTGMDPEVIERVFDPFFTTKASGMGLGLSITRSIIEAHGGRIWAEPLATQGSRFRFVLPVAKASRG